VIYAEDDGIPEKKRGYCTVVIKIIDVNDWSPVFDPVTEFSVNENVPVGFIVGKIIATDTQETMPLFYIALQVIRNSLTALEQLSLCYLYCYEHKYHYVCYLLTPFHISQEGSLSPGLVFY